MVTIQNPKDKPLVACSIYFKASRQLKWGVGEGGTDTVKWGGGGGGGGMGGEGRGDGYSVRSPTVQVKHTNTITPEVCLVLQPSPSSASQPCWFDKTLSHVTNTYLQVQHFCTWRTLLHVVTFQCATNSPPFHTWQTLLHVLTFQCATNSPPFHTWQTILHVVTFQCATNSPPFHTWQTLLHVVTFQCATNSPPFHTCQTLLHVLTFSRATHSAPWEGNSGAGASHLHKLQFLSRSCKCLSTCCKNSSTSDKHSGHVAHIRPQAANISISGKLAPSHEVNVIPQMALFQTMALLPMWKTLQTFVHMSQPLLHKLQVFISQSKPRQAEDFLKMSTQNQNMSWVQSDTHG